MGQDLIGRLILTLQVRFVILNLVFIEAKNGQDLETHKAKRFILYGQGGELWKPNQNFQNSISLKMK